ncbi:mRNA interferase HigB [bacterium A37T11]|nr:mRNA interferase HigB [bacterium A37T11]
MEYCERYPGAKNALLEWYYEFLNSDIKTFQELKQRYPNASLVGDDRVVLNIMGNHYRLVIRMIFTYKVIQVKWFGTHKEYDRIDVKTVQNNR